MHVVECNLWTDFLEWLEPYRQLPVRRRETFLWRGQSNVDDGLISTLDRDVLFRNAKERDEFVDKCLTEFKRDSYSLGMALNSLDGEALELLARHHGLPSPLLDFTISPYIAAYFAFAGRFQSETGKIAIWQVDRALLDVEDQLVQIIDDLELLRFNPRALRQKGIFLKVSQPQLDLAVALGDAVTKIVLPASQAKLALLDLEAMTINAAYLFDSLDGAARAAFHRVVNAGSLV
ncbi:FRG domain-containing protein [Planctomycetales bacterium ZRK34]|nr:FRG domain-containing protein [Planctomycetales bacterium ZRK34]